MRARRNNKSNKKKEPKNKIPKSEEKLFLKWISVFVLPPPISLKPDEEEEFPNALPPQPHAQPEGNGNAVQIGSFFHVVPIFFFAMA